MRSTVWQIILYKKFLNIMRRIGENMLSLFSPITLQVSFSVWLEIGEGIIVFIIAIIVSTWIYLNQDEMTWKEYGIFTIGTMIFASVMIGLITWSFNDFLMYGSWLIFPAFLLTWKRKIQDEADESD